MIIDTLDNIETYASLNPLFPKVIEFLRQNDISKLEPKVYEISGEDAFINIQQAYGRSEEEALLESHKKMIDIQIPLEVTERYGYENTNQLPEHHYDEKKDLILYGDERAKTYVECKVGMFVIFLPQDAHAPLVSPQKEFRKAIIKVKVD